MNIKRYKLIDRDFVTTTDRMLAIDDEETRKLGNTYAEIATKIVAIQSNMATPVINDSFAKKVIAYLANCLADSSMFHKDRGYE
jgi:hypothetical protein